MTLTCDHTPVDLGTETCPRWPSCVTPGPPRPETAVTAWTEHSLSEAEAAGISTRYRAAVAEMRVEQRVDAAIEHLRTRRHEALLALGRPLGYRPRHRRASAGRRG